MSYELLISLNKPIDTESLLRTTRVVLKELLLSKVEDLTFEAMVYGITSSDIPDLLTEESGTLRVNYLGVTRSEVFAISLDTEHNMLTGCVSFRHDQTIDPVIAVACSIAMARISKTKIEDPALRLGKSFYYNSEELFDNLKCKTSHTKSATAFAEIITNIEKARK